MKLKNFVFHFLLLVAVCVTSFPAIRIFSISLRPGNKLLSSDLGLIPKGATFDSYLQLLTERPFLNWIFNSFVVTISTSIIGVVGSATAAYALSRCRFPGRKAGLVFLMMTQMIPGVMLILPIYLALSQWGLVNSFKGLITAYSVTCLPFSIWILKGYFDSIPHSLEEAARIDGCSELSSFYRIVLPLSTPALAIVFLFNFTQTWNEYIMASTLLQSPNLRTWPLGLRELQGNFNSEWGMFAAGSVMISIPVIFIFLFTGRYMVSGLTLGGVKG